MPSPRHPSQPDNGPPGWLRSSPGEALLGAVQRAALPELTRIFGQYGLYIRPSVDISRELSGNLLGNVLSLYRDGDHFSGDFTCAEGELSICPGSLSLIYALFILEESIDPGLLLEEFARVLKPEGFVLVIGMNAWSPTQFRWLKPPRATSASRLQRLAQEAGLEVVRRQTLGPFWPANEGAMLDVSGSSWLDSFRASTLSVLRRREAALTPLRKPAAAVSLRPGMSAG